MYVKKTEDLLNSYGIMGVNLQLWSQHDQTLQMFPFFDAEVSNSYVKKYLKIQYQ